MTLLTPSSFGGGRACVLEDGCGGCLSLRSRRTGLIQIPSCLVVALLAHLIVFSRFLFTLAWLVAMRSALAFALGHITLLFEDTKRTQNQLQSDLPWVTQ
jgi:hypothetical protein